MVRKRCQICKNNSAIPIAPLMADLPTERVSPGGSPFTYVGIDYFGPINVIRGRALVKRYGVLFTCLVTRAIHIEIADDLSSDSAIQCIRRFICDRGLPVRVWTDNGTNFRGAKDELAAFNQEEITNSIDYFEWEFIPPASPHMGGAWERLVRSVKTTLKAINPIRVPTDGQFRTYMKEVQNIINSRPLTYVPIDPDAEEALTPNHFLLMSSNGSKTPGTFCDDGKSLKRMWIRTQLIADEFWKKWIKEYLPTLLRRSKWFEAVPAIKIGSVGMLWDSTVRNSWKLGRVIEIFPSQDGQVRQIMVKTANGVYKRPVNKFAVLDIDNKNNVEKLNGDGETSEHNMQPETPNVSADVSQRGDSVGEACSTVENIMDVPSDLSKKAK